MYITLTTISSRVNKIENTIISLLNGEVLADRIYLFISSEPFLLDAGIYLFVDQFTPILILSLLHYYTWPTTPIPTPSQSLFSLSSLT